MSMRQHLLSIFIIVSLLASALPAQAVGTTEEPSSYPYDGTVTVDDIVLSRCGPQSIALSGTVTLDLDQNLVVRLDRKKVPFTLNGTLWITDLILTDVGDHTVTAERNTGSGGIIIGLDADSKQFTVQPCSTPTPTPDPTPTPTATPAQTSNDGGGGGGDGGNDGGGGGGGEEPQPTLKPVPKKGQVKGTITKKIIAGAIPNKLVPTVVERLFKEVFGRAIKPFESTYWKVRARTDKVTETLLKGTMQWYKLKGKTKGL